VRFQDERLLVRCQEKGTFGEMPRLRIFGEIPRLRIFGEMPRSEIEKKDFF
jgi:hypothetical protein